jgi:hypothetical protein
VYRLGSALGSTVGYGSAHNAAVSLHPDILEMMIMYERRQNTFHKHFEYNRICHFIPFHFWGDLLPSPWSPCMSYDVLCNMQGLLNLFSCDFLNGSRSRYCCLACSSASEPHFMNVLKCAHYCFRPNKSMLFF